MPTKLSARSPWQTKSTPEKLSVLRSGERIAIAAFQAERQL